MLLRYFWIGLLIFSATVNAQTLPLTFIHLQEVDPSIAQDIRYFTSNNFIGKPVAGYQAATCILTKPAAQALALVQKFLKTKGLGLKVFDCYRPQVAVHEFMVWSEDINDQKTKSEYYPRVNKADFFKLGYVAEKSGHTRGSTLDLTLINLANGQELDMGTHFDFMDESSHALSHSISEQQLKNRMILRQAMQQFGFNPYPEEWWHFTLKNEPYPNTYFNFPVQ